LALPPGPVVCWNRSFEGMSVMVNQAPPATTRRSRTRLVVQAAVSLVLVVAIFYYLRKKFDPAQAWAAITAMTGLELVTLGLLAIWNLCTYAFVWMTVTPGLGFRRAMVMTQATTAVANTVPGGSAIGIGMTYSMLGPWGYSRSRSTTAVLVSGVWNSFIKLAMPVLALALVALQGGRTGGRVIAALLGIAGLVAAVVVFALMLRSAEQARRFGLLAGRIATRLRRVLRRGPVTGWELATVKFRARTVDLVEHRWVAITVTSLVSHLSLYAVLLVALRDVGVSEAEVGWAEVLAVFAFARLATAIPLTPGGAGFVEGVLFTGLVGAGGDPDQVAAAGVVYRALTWALPILVGIGCYLWWRRRSWTTSPEDARRGPSEATVTASPDRPTKG
jgi:putative heme transporter